MPKILCIYPYDKTTKFLENKILNPLITYLKDEIEIINISPNKESHKLCLEKIRKSVDDVIFFFGHGKSDCLYGAIGDKARLVDDKSLSKEAISDNENYYSNESFINKDNINIFKNKVVFCLSCNSNEKLGKWAIDSGCITFVGFGDIPTEWYKEDNINQRETPIFKGRFNRIILNSLLHSIRKQDSIYDLVEMIKLNANREIFDLLKNTHKKQKKLRSDGTLNYHVKSAESLFKFKEDIKIFGDYNKKIF